jgi:hypothetical protein
MPRNWFCWQALLESATGPKILALGFFWPAFEAAKTDQAKRSIFERYFLELGKWKFLITTTSCCCHANAVWKAARNATPALNSVAANSAYPSYPPT